MYELRFILLGVGALTIAGIWWWEQRRTRPTHDYRDPRPGERQDPVLASEPDPVTDELPFVDDEPAIVATRFGAEDRVDLGLPPPLITIDDLPDDVGEVELSDQELAPPAVAKPAPPEPVVAPPAPRTAPGVRPVVGTAPNPRTVGGRHVPAGTAPPIRDMGEVRRVEAEFPPAAPPAESAPGAASEPRAAETRAAAEPDGRSTTAALTEQRIVAIRMVAGRLPVAGRALLAALESESLEFGRYAIFHRQRADGRLLFSVASLLEPGSFDIDEMVRQSFPGVSLFAVFPGPGDAAQVFDDMLATARRLADRLGGSLQDERGIALSAQRILALREDLVRFQDLVNQAKSRGAG
jgi:cell division protein ZipA